MNTINLCSAKCRITERYSVPRIVATCLLIAGLGSYPKPSPAADGCLVLLCFAAPSWRAIPECVPQIQEVLHDLARGRPFPTCDMAGSENTASHRWSSAPTYCPPQYTQQVETDSTPIYLCDYVGAVSVVIENALWTRTWWSMAGDTVTEYTPVAKQLMGTWDPRFDNDYAAWQASQPPVPPCDGC